MVKEHTVNGVKLTDAQYEEYSKLTSESEKQAYLSSHKSVNESASEKSKQEAEKKEIKSYNKDAKNWWETSDNNAKVDANKSYVEVKLPDGTSKWITKEAYDKGQAMQKKDIRTGKMVTDFAGAMEFYKNTAGVDPDVAKNVTSKHAKPKENTATLSMPKKPLTDEEIHEATKEADKNQAKEDKSYNKVVKKFGGEEVDNTSGYSTSLEDSEIGNLTPETYWGSDGPSLSELFEIAEKEHWGYNRFKGLLEKLYEGKEGKGFDNPDSLLSTTWAKSSFGKKQDEAALEAEKTVRNLDDDPTNDVKSIDELRDKNTTTEPEGNGGNGGNGGGNGPAPKGDNKDTPKEPKVPEVEEAPEKAKGDEPDPRDKNKDGEVDDVEDDKFASYLKNINDQKTIQEKLKDPNLSPADRAALKDELKGLQQAGRVLEDSLVTTDKNIEDLAGKGKQFEKYLNKTRQKGLVSSWASESKQYRELISEAEDDLKKAQESGNKADIAEAQSRLKELKNARSDMHQEYGMFLINSLGAALTNAGQAAMGNVPGAKSLWQERTEKNLNAETDRWNEYRDKSISRVGNAIDQQFGEESEVKQTYNKMLADDATKRRAIQLGILEKPYGVEAINEMKKYFGGNVGETMEVMSLLGYGMEQQAMVLMNRAGVDLNGLANSVGEAVQNGVDGLSGVLEGLNALIEKIENSRLLGGKK